MHCLSKLIAFVSRTEGRSIKGKNNQHNFEMYTEVYKPTFALKFHLKVKVLLYRYSLRWKYLQLLLHNPSNIFKKSGDKTLRPDLRGGFTVKLIKLASGPLTGTSPFQGSERGPSNAFML